MPDLRLITWNCHHGSIERQLRPLAKHSPDIVFLQEWLPPAPDGPFVARQVRPRKGVALCAMSSQYQLKEIAQESLLNHSAVAAEVSGPVDFIAAGVWAQGPNYAADVLRFLKAHSALLRSAPAVVMGDLNMGSKLGKGRRPTHRSAEVFAAFADLGLVSAYHAFHHCAHGEEPHATYRHLFKRRQPWHIDFCFIPESWRAAVTDVTVLDSRTWAKRSDHSPVRISVSLEPHAADALVVEIRDGARPPGPHRRALAEGKTVPDEKNLRGRRGQNSEGNERSAKALHLLDDI